LHGDDADRPTSELRGEQCKLAAIRACLASRPDVFAGRARVPPRRSAPGALEALIRGFDGAVVIVSHDRYLLDETVTEIAGLENGRIRAWPGNYSAYALARELALKRR
jgi:ATP-binding cassette, subfamily F, member 3